MPTNLVIDVIGHDRLQAFSRAVYEEIAERPRVR